MLIPFYSRSTNFEMMLLLKIKQKLKHLVRLKLNINNLVEFPSPLPPRFPSKVCSKWPGEPPTHPPTKIVRSDHPVRAPTAFALNRAMATARPWNLDGHTQHMMTSVTVYLPPSGSNAFAIESARRPARRRAFWRKYCAHRNVASLRRRAKAYCTPIMSSMRVTPSVGSASTTARI